MLCNNMLRGIIQSVIVPSIIMLCSSILRCIMQNVFMQRAITLCNKMLCGILQSAIVPSVMGPLTKAHVAATRESLLKGKAQYGWPPCTNKFGLGHFYTENVIHFGWYQGSLTEGEVSVQLISLY